MIFGRVREHLNFKSTRKNQLSFADHCFYLYITQSVFPSLIPFYLIPYNINHPRRTGDENKGVQWKEEDGEQPMKAAPTFQFINWINDGIIWTALEQTRHGKAHRKSENL